MYTTAAFSGNIFSEVYTFHSSGQWTIYSRRMGAGWGDPRIDDLHTELITLPPPDGGGGGGRVDDIHTETASAPFGGTQLFVMTGKVRRGSRATLPSGGRNVLCSACGWPGYISFLIFPRLSLSPFCAVHVVMNWERKNALHLENRDNHQNSLPLEGDSSVCVGSALALMCPLSCHLAILPALSPAAPPCGHQWPSLTREKGMPPLPGRHFMPHYMCRREGTFYFLFLPFAPLSHAEPQPLVFLRDMFWCDLPSLITSSATHLLSTC